MSRRITVLKHHNKVAYKGYMRLDFQVPDITLGVTFTVTYWGYFHAELG